MSRSGLDTAFNISILYLVPNNLIGLGQIDSLDIFDVNGEFNDRGLYSIPYFGAVGDIKRSRRVAYIDTKIEIMHPLIFLSLNKLRAFYSDIIYGKKYAVWNPEIKDFDPADVLTKNAGTGFSFFLKYWKQIDFKRNKSASRNERITFIENNKEKAMTSKVLVIPAGIRDLEVGEDGRPVSDEINDIYRKLLGASNTISEAGVKHNPELFDNTRLRLQLIFQELFEYIVSLTSGKKKLLAGKWLSRRIQNGTRNVITSFIHKTTKLGEKGIPNVNNTLVGLLQFLVAIGQSSKYLIKTGPISHAFVSPDLPARLINKDSLESEEVYIEPEVYDLWMSNEGLDKLYSRFTNKHIRHKPIEISNHYPALIYKGPDATFKIFYDIRDLPEGFNKKYVSPITLTELLYLSVYDKVDEYPAFMTRYPIAGEGSIYPSISSVKTTIESEKRYPLNENWQKDPELTIAFEFPIVGGEFYDTLSPHTTRLAGLTADHDGDQGY